MVTALLAGCAGAFLGGIVVLYLALGVLYVVNGGLPEQTAVGAFIAAIVSVPILFVVVAVSTRRRLENRRPIPRPAEPRRPST